ncbi:hypothetical protein BKA62DRAFT_676753 [Auriculariales sp. MPI-PUGE-AT-0066]|nr:hypothetical protein BKA62DRAFT_676753 [Auriculariales sp. MPI-PUGE-AT-0066]
MVFRARMIFVARRRLDAADAVDALRLRRPSAPRPSVTSIRDTGVGARQGVYHQTDATRGTRWTHFGCVDRRRRALRLHPSEIPVWVHARVSITRGRGGRTSAASTTNAARFRYIHPRYRCGCTPGCLSPGRRDAGDALDALRLRRPSAPRPSVTSIRDTGVGARQGVYHQTDATRGTRWTHSGVGARQGVYHQTDATQGTRWTHFGCVDHQRRAIPLHPSEIPVWVHARVSITRPTRRGGRGGRTSAASTVGAAPFGYIHPRYRCGCTPGCLSPDRRDAGDALDALRLARDRRDGSDAADAIPLRRNKLFDSSSGCVTGLSGNGIHPPTRCGLRCVDHQRRAIPLHVYYQVDATRGTRWTHFGCVDRRRRAIPLHPSEIPVWVHARVSITRGRGGRTSAASTVARRAFVTSIRDTGVGARQGIYHQTDATRGTRWTHFGCVDRRRRALLLHPSEIPVWVHARVSITRSTRRAGRGGRALRRPPTPRDSLTCIRDTGVGARQGVYYQVDTTRQTRMVSQSNEIVLHNPIGKRRSPRALPSSPPAPRIVLAPAQRSSSPLPSTSSRSRTRHCLCNALIAAVAPRQPQRHACDECDGVAGATVDATATLSHPPLPLHRGVVAAAKRSSSPARLDAAKHALFDAGVGSGKVRGRGSLCEGEEEAGENESDAVRGRGGSRRECRARARIDVGVYSSKLRGRGSPCEGREARARRGGSRRECRARARRKPARMPCEGEDRCRGR